jgi:hypothetical protein
MSYKAMNNPAFEQIAEDCGLWIDMTNLEVSYNEISFYSKQIVNECIAVLQSRIQLIGELDGESTEKRIAHNKTLLETIACIKLRFDV